MLICNNCNTVNDDHCQKCKHCRMSGNFRRRIGENKSDNTPVLHVKVVCLNCGSDSPGEEVKCVHCCFPLARTKVSGNQQEVITSERSSTNHSFEKQS